MIQNLIQNLWQKIFLGPCVWAYNDQRKLKTIVVVDTGTLNQHPKTTTIVYNPSHGILQDTSWFLSVVSDHYL